MIHERDLTTSEFNEKIQRLNRALSKEKDTRVHRAIIFERTGILKAKADFLARKSIELREFQREQGRDAPGRAEDLRHDWWNDEDAGPVQAVRSSRGWGEDRKKGFSRLVSPFDDRWSVDLV